MRPWWVAATARRVAGRITSTTGTSYRSRASRSIAAEAELQAMTSALTPCSTRWSRHSRAYSRTSPIGLGPYGWRAVSPTYTIDSCGSWSMTDRATVRPPKPESKMPMGASTVPGPVMVCTARKARSSRPRTAGHATEVTGDDGHAGQGGPVFHALATAVPGPRPRLRPNAHGEPLRGPQSAHEGRGGA